MNDIHYPKCGNQGCKAPFVQYGFGSAIGMQWTHVCDPGNKQRNANQATCPQCNNVFQRVPYEWIYGFKGYCSQDCLAKN